MSRGRHARPEPPRSERLLLVLALVVAVVAVSVVWIVDDAWQLRVAATGVLVTVVVAMFAAARSSSAAADRWRSESLHWRNELLEVQREVAELRTNQVELLLELRATRGDVLAAAHEAERREQARDDQQVLVRQLLAPRPAVADPVYPSLHLPLVRAAFSTELPASPPPPAAKGTVIEREESSGHEPMPPRQLLDLTASEIARLRAAN
jgi:hypothetical protein